MDRKELTELLVASSEQCNQNRFIPWWQVDDENCIYVYDILEDEIIQDRKSVV